MFDPSAFRVIVVGAGVVGSSIALVLAQDGADVTLIDPAALGDNASGVAAGMLAPAFEALLDPLSAGHFALLREARDLWPAFALRLGVDQDIGLSRAGALWIGEDAQRHERALGELGAHVERLPARRTAALAPDHGADRGEGVFTAEDWRLDVSMAMQALARIAARAGVETLQARVRSIENSVAVLTDGRRLEADAIVVATGAGETMLAPELTHIAPVKGHILGYAQPVGRGDGPVLRCAGGYGVMGAGGARVGATMQPDRRDHDIEPPVVARLHALAVALFPALQEVSPTPAIGIRATTADGLPLVGPSTAPGVWLAVGARRNGWLLAPMIAAMMQAYLAGDDPGPWASSFDPRRFDR